MPTMQTKHTIYTGLLSLNRAVVSCQEITHAEYPAYMWDQLGRAVQVRLNVNSTRADLRRFLAEWDRLPQDNVQRLVHSIRQRCAACIAACGGLTHY